MQEMWKYVKDKADDFEIRHIFDYYRKGDGVIVDLMCIILKRNNEDDLIDWDLFLPGQDESHYDHVFDEAIKLFYTKLKK